MVEHYLEILQLCATVFLTLVVHATSKAIANTDYKKSIADQWLHIDSIAASSDIFLTEIDSLLHPDKKNDPIEIKRRRLVGYIVLNPYASQYHAIQKKLFTRKDLDGVEKRLAVILRDKTVCESVFEEEIYDSSFVKFCKEIVRKYSLHTDHV